MNTLVPWDPRMPELWHPPAVPLVAQVDLVGCRGEKTIVNCLGIHGFFSQSPHEVIIVSFCLWGTFLGAYPVTPHLLHGQEQWQI